MDKVKTYSPGHNNHMQIGLENLHIDKNIDRVATINVPSTINGYFQIINKKNDLNNFNPNFQNKDLLYLNNQINSPNNNINDLIIEEDNNSNKRLNNPNFGNYKNEIYIHPIEINIHTHNLGNIKQMSIIL